MLLIILLYQTLGNAADFGDSNRLTILWSCSNAVRGIFAGGYVFSGTIHNTIDYITLATLGNAVDFGDLTSTRGYTGWSSITNKSMFSWGGHRNPNATQQETIDYVQIMQPKEMQ